MARKQAKMKVQKSIQDESLEEIKARTSEILNGLSVSEQGYHVPESLQSLTLEEYRKATRPFPVTPELIAMRAEAEKRARERFESRRQAEPALLPWGTQFWDHVEAGIQFIDALLALPVEGDMTDKRNHKSYPTQAAAHFRNPNSEYRRIHEAIIKFDICYGASTGSRCFTEGGPSRIEEDRVLTSHLSLTIQQVRMFSPNWRTRYENVSFNPGIRLDPVKDGVWGPLKTILHNGLFTQPANITQEEKLEILALRAELLRARPELMAHGLGPSIAPSRTGLHSPFSEAVNKWLEMKQSEELWELFETYTPEELDAHLAEGMSSQYETTQVERVLVKKEQAKAPAFFQHLEGSNEEKDPQPVPTGFLDVSVEHSNGKFWREQKSIKFKPQSVYYALMIILLKNKERVSSFDQLFKAWTWEGKKRGKTEMPDKGNVRRMIHEMNKRIKDLGIEAENDQDVGYSLVTIEPKQ